MLLMYRYKYTSKEETVSRGLYNFCETLLIFEDSKLKVRLRNKREIEILRNALLALYAERLMSVEQSIMSKSSQAITSENKAKVMLDHPGKRSTTFEMQIGKIMFELCFSLPIPVAINIP